MWNKLFAVVILQATLASAAERCKPCQSSCWPTDAEVAAFENTLNGSLIRPTDKERFEVAANVYNYRLYRSPGLIVDPKNTGDVKKAMKFAQDHNMSFSIKSSGHDFVGRNTAYGSLLLNMRSLRTINVDETQESVTVQSGATWGEVYEAVDQYDRVIVGGSSPTVCMGGYTTGGGHSPMSRMYGLAVDNVIAFQIVTADQQLWKCTADGCVIIHDNGTEEPVADSADLFWAVRGGGAGFGVLINFTYKIHVPPQQFVHLSIVWPTQHGIFGVVGERVMNFYNNFVQTLPNQWGGYLLINNAFGDGYQGSISFSLLHVGPWEEAYPSIEPLLNQEPEAQLFQTLTNHSSFWSYQQNVDDYGPGRLYIINRFIQMSDLGPRFTELMTQTLLDNEYKAISCTGAHIGGKVREKNLTSAAISEGFRNGIMSLSCGVSWQNEYLDDIPISGLKSFSADLYTFGQNVYYNEPDSDLSDWKDDFWFPHYDNLLAKKKKVPTATLR